MSSMMWYRVPTRAAGPWGSSSLAAKHRCLSLRRAKAVGADELEALEKYKDAWEAEWAEEAELAARGQSKSRHKRGAVRAVKVSDIRRPLERTRGVDDEKVRALMASIDSEGQQVPIDVLEVEGQLYGFSGCNRYEAVKRLGRETILARVVPSTRQSLRMHLL
mmetsp:Transcript_15792/g.51758  ORF Transcript_15792/g.51758 Transcript_15792/m.51758 type:complete len:163 (-) Transcript_15792:115-603(-)